VKIRVFIHGWCSGSSEFKDDDCKLSRAGLCCRLGRQGTHGHSCVSGDGHGRNCICGNSRNGGGRCYCAAVAIAQLTMPMAAPSRDAIIVRLVHTLVRRHCWDEDKPQGLQVHLPQDLRNAGRDWHEGDVPLGEGGQWRPQSILCQRRPPCGNSPSSDKNRKVHKMCGVRYLKIPISSLDEGWAWNQLLIGSTPPPSFRR
jgi:hypothetical protein